MLAISAGAAGITSLLGFDLTAQIIVFAVVAIVLLLTLRPWARRVLERSVPNTRLNFHALLGQEALVEETVTGEGGRVRLAGDTWTALTKDEVDLEVGEVVYVNEIAGASVVVSRVKA